MKVSDLDYEKRKIRVMGKVPERVVLFGSGAATSLKAHLNGRETGYIFEEVPRVQKGCVTTADNNTWIGVFKVYGERPGCSRKVEFSLGPKSKITYDQAWAVFRQRTKGLNLVRPKKQGPLGPDAIRNTVSIVAMRARIKHATPHMLRHSFATHMLDRGAGIREIQELLGHKSLRNTEVYTRISKERLLSTFDRYHPRGAQAQTLPQ